MRALNSPNRGAQSARPGAWRGPRTEGDDASTAAEPVGQVVGAFARQLYLAGCVPRVELSAWLGFSAIEDPIERAAIIAHWERGSAKFEQISKTEAGEPDAIECLPLRNTNQRRAAKILSSKPEFMRTFSGNCRWRFEVVEIDRLVVCQRLLDLDFVGAHHPSPPTHGADLVSFCLDPGQASSRIAVTRRGPGQFTFSSSHPALKFLGVQKTRYPQESDALKEVGGSPAWLLSVVVGIPVSTINAYAVGRRRILQNGLHRLFALRRAGVTHAPILAIDIGEPEIEIPDPMIEIPRDYAVSAPRPTILRDFMDSTLACSVRQRRLFGVLDVNVTNEKRSVPLA